MNNQQTWIIENPSSTSLHEQLVTAVR